MTKHSPTPYTYEENGLIRNKDGQVAQTFDPLAEGQRYTKTKTANAAFICQAVNNFEELLWAAKHFRQCGDKHDPPSYKDCDRAEAALKKAGA